mmetsp:Transcript_16150/g.34928  ORF Transcript_16150/g.34928 Transcript_16150/m.34928 type:complete len:681 (+) Transcript_16150:140-2182(+)|eukprot:CAMPEP_0206475440 /NCGR_PEP_ID=MMETSP0324_2-20121206/34081_1 /ASSEMBLY_ACC=CAM_ASM_000836 /TAXON_ID=2866 /ORGANISM="Crypthecodinium cohnii, Strain Seligo" /LENGTH=680 /DNA_ID=CAMNT_0053950799 /DNA_START=117 /DNA_END=2159 /DNA_ORIENTATION=-
MAPAPRVFSVEVPGTEDPEKGWGAIHRGVDKDPPMLGLRCPKTGALAMTSWENFCLSRAKFGKDPFLGHRPIKGGVAGDYVWQSYEEVGKLAEAFGAGCVNLALAPPTNDPELNGKGLIGLYSKNRPEWVIAEQGCYSQSIIPVPSYDTLGADSIAYVINQTNMKTMVCSEEVVENLITCKPQCPSFLVIVQMETPTEDQKAKAKAAGLVLLGFDEVVANGKLKPAQLHPPQASDIATFCYTSGTTGDPKGALLTHENLIADAAACNARFDLGQNDVHLSYLPLPHVFERGVHVLVVNGGGRIGFYQGDTLKILEDLQALRPTLFPSVPRLLNRIHDRLWAQVEEAGGLKLKLFKTAFAAKMEGLKAGTNKHALWDRLVFSKIQQRVGLDRCRVMVTGSAPIADHVLSFLRVVFCCPVMEGYGMTETTSGSTVTYLDDFTPGTVGAPLPCNEIRLQDVPDMGYTRLDTTHGEGAKAMPCRGRGEICFRGTNIFKGYYKMPDKTKEAIDEEGWMHSGDIGLWTVDGRLKIIDRKKNIFKLQQGEYVAPEKIENINAQSSFVAQNFVYGDSLQRELVSVVVVDPDSVAAWAKKAGKKGDVKELCQDEDLKQTVLKDLKAIAAKEKLQGFEIVKDVHLEPDVWQPGGDILTPTFKLQRNKAQKKYEDVIHKLYDKLSTPKPKL